MNVFEEMGIYWAEIADKNQTDEQIEFMKNTLKGDGLVLDLACGTGRHSIPLGKDGYDIIGLDISLNLLRIANSRWSGIQLVRGDMRYLPFEDGAFSAAVSMDTSFGYLPSEGEDIKSLKELRGALSRGGEVIVDVFNRELLILKYKPSQHTEIKWVFFPMLLKFNNRLVKWLLFRFFRWTEYPSFFLLQKRTVNASGDKLCDLWAVCDKAEGTIRVFRHSARLYGLKPLQVMLDQAGFIVKQVYGDYDGQSFSRNSRRLILVAYAK